MMKTAIRQSVALLTFAAVVGVYRIATAQTPPSLEPQSSQQKAQAQEMAPLRGELLRVDTEAKTLAVKTADGTEVQFAYSDQTQITGAERGVAGLATLKGPQVVVHYERQESGAKGPAYRATKIEVMPQAPRGLRIQRSNHRL